MMLTTGMLIFGKISVGVGTIASVHRIRMRKTMTTKVKGRFSASRTIHMTYTPIFLSGHTGLHQPNRTYARCFGVLESKVEINWPAAGGTATVPDRTISLAGIFLPYSRRLSPLSGRIVEPS